MAQKKTAAPEESALIPLPIDLKVEPAVDHSEELVTIMLQKDNNAYKDDLTVIVNGTRYTVKRGKPVKIPRFVADIVSQSMEQDGMTAAYSEQLEKGYQKAVDDGMVL